MNALGKQAHPDDLDFRTWVALKRIEAPRPPYDENFEVTSTSLYGHGEWRFDKDTLAHGSKLNGRLLLTREVRLSDKQTFTMPPRSLLMTQLKDTVAAYIFHRTYLPNRIEASKPATVVHDGKRLLILYANIGATGLQSIGEVRPKALQAMFKNLANADSVHDQLIQYFEDILILSRQGLITAGPTGTRYKLSPRLPPVPFHKKSKTRTLEDNEVSFLISRSLTYIDKTEEIVAKIKACDGSPGSNKILRDWAYNCLPVTSGLERANVKTQLVWLIRISAYNLIAFHLGSRASEALSSTGCSLEVIRSADGMLDEVYIWLTITKGASGNGVPRRYRVHPFFLRIFAVLNLLNAHLGVSSEDYLFKGNDPHEISGSNLLSKVKRFVTMHNGDFDISTHTWRFTLSDVVVGTIDKPFIVLAERLGHKHISDAIGYGMHGPSGDKLRDAARTAAADAVERFVSDCEIAELGGVQGLKIRAALQTGGTTVDLKEDLEIMGIVPVPVGENKFCLKGRNEIGPCGVGSDKKRREIAKCHDDCSNQVQMPPLRDFWYEFIQKLPKLCSNADIPMMEKVRQIAALEQNLVAWPELKHVLATTIRNNPKLGIFF